MIHESILSTIGNTPVVRVNRIAPAHTTLRERFAQWLGRSHKPTGSSKLQGSHGLL